MSDHDVMQFLLSRPAVTMVWPGIGSADLISPRINITQHLLTIRPIRAIGMHYKAQRGTTGCPFSGASAGVAVAAC